MTFVITIGGSPSASSKSTALLGLVRTRLEQSAISTDALQVRDLPAEDLLHARVTSSIIQSALGLIERAQGVVIATPIYKAAYTGILKAFLDLLPPDALAGKIVLPIATGATLGHMLAIDYALRPVLVALGSPHILNGVYLLDSQFISTHDAGVQLDSAADERLTSAVAQLARFLSSAQP